MKAATCQNRARIEGRGRRGYTLTNLMVSMAIFLTALTALITTHLFGLRMFEINKMKLGASQEIPHVVNPVAADMKEARMVRVGSGTLSTFTEAAANSLQQGNAVQIYNSTDTNAFVRYYVDSADATLRRRAADGSVTVITPSVTNSVVFTVEDMTGQVLSNRAVRSVVGMNLQFSAVENSGDKVGATRYAQGFRIHGKFAVKSGN